MINIRGGYSCDKIYLFNVDRAWCSYRGRYGIPVLGIMAVKDPW
jgi:hypothetical protein